jgi:putative transposase
VTSRYEFIGAEYANVPAEEAGDAPTIVQMCRWLGVSKSGYYEWRSRPQSAAARRRELLKIKIGALFEANDGTYGYRRMHAALVRGGERVGEELVRQLMRELGLVACQPAPWRPATTRQGDAGPIPDLVNRDFSAGAPGEKMVGDITYIDTWEGWLYLATVIDCATRKVVGWAMDDNYKTPLITAAIEMAARNVDLPADAVFHSDRGSNYQYHLVKQGDQRAPDFQRRVVPVAHLAGLFYREGASFVLLDDARVGPLAAAFIYSFQDLRNRCFRGSSEPSGGKMPPGR